MSPETEAKIRSGQYVEEEQLVEIQSTAQDAWDLAGAERGPWETNVDVADLTKMCNELVARRADEPDRLQLAAMLAELDTRLQYAKTTHALLKRSAVSSSDAVLYEHIMGTLEGDIVRLDEDIRRLKARGLS